MPLKRCQEGGEPGWKFGDHGKCYVGKNGKKLAIKQGLAELGPEEFKKHLEKGSFTAADLINSDASEIAKNFIQDLFKE